MNVYGRRYFCQDAYALSVRKLAVHMSSSGSRDRIVVSTLRCGRNNPGSNPDHGTFFSYYAVLSIFTLCKLFFFFRLLLKKKIK